MLTFARNLAFITHILKWAQLAKFTKTKGCSADSKGPKMYPELNPFGKWLMF